MFFPLTLLFGLCSLLFISRLSAQSNPNSDYWVNTVQRQGLVAFGDPSYPVFRNVLDYGATGDGMTDDTDAINLAISYPGTRCGGGNASYGSFCQSQTTTPAMIYFPPGTYLVSAPIIMYYFSQLVGDALDLPTIKVSSNFQNIVGLAVFDSDVYIPAAGGNEWYANQNNFYRQVRNFVIDMTDAPLFVSGVHWQVAQATSLQNIVFNMTAYNSTNQQQGIYMENGSGGFMTDLVFIGGAIGAFLGNQQFTSRNMSFNGCGTAIYMNFDWLWTFHGLNIENCQVGIDMTSGGFVNQAVGSVVVLDSVISASQGILTPYTPGFSSPQSAGTLVLDNVDFTGSAVAIAVAGGTSSRTVLSGGQYIQSFAQGNAWTTAGQALNGQIFNGTACVYQNASQTAYTAQETTIQQQLAPIPRPSNLVDSTGRYFARSRPQYETTSSSSFLSAKSTGLIGDGATDDSDAMQALMTLAGQTPGSIVYFDHGAYLVTTTINIPANVKITGECYSIIMATGSFFSDQDNPQPMWSIGSPGESGTVEISDLVFETQGPAPGAIMIEWNIDGSGVTQGGAGMWDAHWRIGGSAGTQLQLDTCLKEPGTTISTDPATAESETAACQGAFMLLHVTSEANGYFENTWGWVADHELDMGDRDQIDIYNGRGALIQSAEGPVWMYGTAFEHSVLFDYQFAGASNVYAGHIQHETAYFQGNPSAKFPFTPNADYSDPTFSDCSDLSNCARTWGLRLVNSSNIFIYAAGLYNFFDNWSTTACLASESCQQHMVNVVNCSEIYLWALSTKGSSFLVDYDGTDLVPYSVNQANFCDTIVLFEVSSTE